jgi:formylglycine-generating enzyme
VGEMVKIPAGDFSMGSSTGDDDEKPAHRVTVASYWLDRTEVTVEAFGSCVAAGACGTPGTGDDCCWGVKGKEQHPINCIEWKSTAAYCAWVGKRLPTEVEWEYAARDGSEGHTYPWGEAAPDERRLNACGSECAAKGADAGERVTAMYPGNDGWETTAPVGSFPPGDDRWGVHDLEGNVREWLASLHCPYDAPVCDSFHVTRGAAYNDNLVFGVRGARRSWHSPSGAATVGFRCARDG